MTSDWGNKAIKLQPRVVQLIDRVNFKGADLWPVPYIVPSFLPFAINRLKTFCKLLRNLRK